MKRTIKTTLTNYSFILFAIVGIAYNCNAQLTNSSKNSIHITNPTTNTVWTTGQSTSIQWTSSLPSKANIRIWLYRGNTFVAPIANITPNSGSYNYNVSNSLPSGANYRIRVFNTANQAVYDLSDYFTITNNNGNKSSFAKNQHIQQQYTIELCSIYPNPQLNGATSQVFIESNEVINTQLFISDLSGRIVLQETIKLIKGKNSVSIPNTIAKGIYFVSLQIENTVQTLRLIIE